MANKTKKKAGSLPRTVQEALLRGYSYPGGSDDGINCDPEGGLGGFERVRGEVDLFDVNGAIAVSIPFTATLEFGKPKPASTKDTVTSL